MKRSSVILSAAMTVICATGLSAQPDTLDVHGVVAMLRATGSAGAATRFLAQEGRRHSARELDELGDSLVAIAASYRRGDPLELLRAAREARGALLASDHPGHLAERAQQLAEREMLPPVPYPRAFDELVEAFQRGQEVGIKSGTLWCLTQLPDTARAVAFLVEVARSNDLAVSAVHYLSMDTGEAGERALRRLYETDAVVDPGAREMLFAIASGRGWKR